MDYLIFVVAMGALIYGADFVIKEAERIALHFNISHFIIGATIVGFGTSLPELASSISATLKNNDDIAVANVVGSIIFNITLVLGLIFLIANRVAPKRDIFKKDSAWSLFPISAFILMGMDGVFSRVDGLLLLLMMGGYILFLLQDSKDIEKNIDVDEKDAREHFNWIKTVGFLLVGFILVIVGADFAIESSSNIAKSLGVSDWIVGIFLVAFGTSLPELTVSIAAARRNNADMSIGNIIGSNISNICVVLGGASVVAPLDFSLQENIFEIVLMLLATLMLIFITANRLYNKSAGIGLLILFVTLVVEALKPYLS